MCTYQRFLARFADLRAPPPLVALLYAVEIGRRSRVVIIPNRNCTHRGIMLDLNKFLVRLYGEYNTSLALWKHFLILLLQSF